MVAYNNTIIIYKTINPLYTKGLKSAQLLCVISLYLILITRLLKFIDFLSYFSHLGLVHYSSSILGTSAQKISLARGINGENTPKILGDF